VTRALLGAIAIAAYVLPGDRVLEQVAARRASAPALRVEARLEGIGESWPARVVLELHPRLGCRVSDERNERWVLHDGHVALGTRMPAPPWIPEIEVLAAADVASLAKLLGELGIDATRSELGRCGERDCFVLGGRASRAQLWIDKDSFEVVELRLADRRRIEFAPARAFGGTRFPGEIHVHDEWGKIATLRVESAGRATDLRAEDFTRRWVEVAPGAAQP
jgi:hypothetical protein